jgi:Na+-translocating ferredoxin:NAD+ oxidoreductase RNF subunit RnfB
MLQCLEMLLSLLVVCAVSLIYGFVLAMAGFNVQEGETVDAIVALLPTPRR